MDNLTFAQWLQQLARYPGLFMTGTDTGVGKTWVGTQLLQHLRAQGLRITPRKPVESGWPNEQITETDSWKLAACASGFQALHRVCPNPLQAPLSPPRAAQLEDKSLLISELARQCRQGVQAGEFLYVEGAGGFYSPLAADGLNADLAQALGLPLILLSDDRVGCINHVLLTVAAMQQRQLQLAGIILNRREASPPDMDNLHDLRALLSVPVFSWQQQS